MNILFLSQRVPEPPNKGDKIRAHHLARRLSRRHSVHLGFLLDEEGEEPYARAAQGWAASCHWHRHGRATSALRGVGSALRGRPISAGWFHSNALRKDVAALVRAHRFDVAVAYCSSMAPYLDAFEGPRVVDLVDIDSEKWRQYAERASGLKRAVYSLEHRLLRRYEREIVRTSDRVVVISQAEKESLARFADVSGVDVISNGVELDQWAETSTETPRSGLVFVGALDYFANADGIEHFAREVFPRIRDAAPGTRLSIVGRRPGPSTNALASIDGVDVVGEVADPAPYVWRAAVSVAPLRIAQGLQNKVLEAMAAGTPVVASPAAARGVDGAGEDEILVGDGTEDFAEKTLRLLRDPEGARRRAARAHAFVVDHYSWDRSAEEFEGVLLKAIRSYGARRGETAPREGAP